MRLKEITFDDFMGIKGTKTHEFNGSLTVIYGRNGSGKSTIADGHNWLWSDKDYELNSNPDIRPNDGRDCEPTVTEKWDIDGIEVTFQKSQKLKKSKDGKISLSNAYKINGIEKTAGEVKDFWLQRNVAIDKFIYMSNPNAFMAQNAKDARKVLFGMASEKTDAEIAAGLSGVPETQNLLKSYTLDEIEALQNQTIKDVNKEHGKSGELTAAKISTLETFKTDIDVSEMESRKKSLEQEIAQATAGTNDVEKQIGDLQTKEMRLQFDISAIAQTMSRELTTKKRDTEWELSKKTSEVNTIKEQLAEAGNRLKAAQHNLEAAERLKEPINEQYKQILTRTFDEAKYRITDSDKVCPTCGKPFDESKIAELVEKSKERIKHEHDNFLAVKEADKKEVMAKAESLKATIADHERQIQSIGDEIKGLNDKLSGLLNEQAALQKTYSDYPDSPDFTQNAEYSRLKAEHEQVIAELDKIQNQAPNEATEGIEEKQKELDYVNTELAKASQNSQVDEQIASLEQYGRECEQRRADAEKILYQVQLIRMEKNKTLENAVNRYFQFTKWRLFKSQKNGEIVDDCTPYIDGFSYGRSANHGREIQMQLDICYSLQRYFNAFMPVILDNAESLTERNYLTQDGTQLIALVVRDCDLTIEKR